MDRRKKRQKQKVKKKEWKEKKKDLLDQKIWGKYPLWGFPKSNVPSNFSRA